MKEPKELTQILGKFSQDAGLSRNSFSQASRQLRVVPEVRDSCLNWEEFQKIKSGFLLRILSRLTNLSNRARRVVHHSDSGSSFWGVEKSLFSFFN